MINISINPITRISGFMDVNISVVDNIVVDVAISGTLFRGFESMLIGKHSKDAVYFTQRICGICSSAHSIASSRLLENISKVEINNQAKIIRNIIHGFDFLQNHIRQFYLFQMPDFVNIEPIENNSFQTRLPYDLEQRIIVNYEKAFDFSRLAHEGLSTLGGKAPHNHGIVFGGVAANIDPFNIGRGIEILNEIKSFVEREMLEDLKIIEYYYNDYFNIGKTGHNFMSFGLFDDFPEVAISKPLYILNNKQGIPNYNEFKEYSNDIHSVKNPNNFNFIKAPRLFNQSIEVGPLARAIVSGKLKTSSTMNRIRARVLETLSIIQSLEYFFTLVQNGRNYPIEAEINGQGTGYTDTIRGTLLHHGTVSNGIINAYDIITPSTWNLSSKDEFGNDGPLAKALLGTYIENPKVPIEVIRTIHSFDPCVSCATHVYDVRGNKLNENDYMPW